MLEVFKMQNEQGIDTRVIDAEEAKALHPLLQLDDVEVIGYDTRTGYCDPYLATTAFAKRARDLGLLPVWQRQWWRGRDRSNRYGCRSR